MNYDTQSLKQEAREQTGLQDFGHSFFEQPLAAWSDDLQSSRLNPFGRNFFRRLIIKNLERRLRIINYLTLNPEIKNVRLPPIILISGYPRTGTTLLHNLICQYPEARALQRWELMEPLPPPYSKTYRSDPRIAKVQSSIEPLRGSKLEKMHWVNADDPEECPWGYYNCTGLLGGGCGSVMPTWGTWLIENDQKYTFLEYRYLIQLLLWKNPIPSNGFLVLKSPGTAPQIHHFANVFPEANYLLTHRDPYRSLISTCTVMDAIGQPFTADGLPPLINDGLKDQKILSDQRRFFKKLVKFSGKNPKSVANVRYNQLMEDPVNACTIALEHLEISIPNGYKESISAFLKKHRQGRADPPKAYDTYGYENDLVWAHSDIRRYCDFFGVEQEHKRLVDTK